MFIVKRYEFYKVLKSSKYQINNYLRIDFIQNPMCNISYIV